jgi:hypothetical protein
MLSIPGVTQSFTITSGFNSTHFSGSLRQCWLPRRLPIPHAVAVKPAKFRVFRHDHQQLEFWPLDAGSLDQLNIECHSAWLRHTDIPVGPKFL